MFSFSIKHLVLALTGLSLVATPAFAEEMGEAAPEATGTMDDGSAAKEEAKTDKKQDKKKKKMKKKKKEQKQDEQTQEGEGAGSEATEEMSE